MAMLKEVMPLRRDDAELMGGGIGGTKKVLVLFVQNPTLC